MNSKMVKKYSEACYCTVFYSTNFRLHDFLIGSEITFITRFFSIARIFKRNYDKDPPSFMSGTWPTDFNIT